MTSVQYDLFVVLAIIIANVILCIASKNSDRIVIIGAGPAGIEAAIYLYQHEFENVIILEAESYIGGYINTEVKQSSAGGHNIIERGDQWILAIDEPLETSAINYLNNDNDFLSSVSFMVYDPDYLIPFLFSNGTKLSVDASKEAHQFLMGIYNTDNTAEEFEDLSLSSYIHKTSATSSRHLANLQEEINRFYETFILAHSSLGDWNEFSYSSFIDQVVRKGNTFKYIKGGLSSLFNLSFDNQIDSPRNLSDIVRLNKVVSQIDYTGTDIIIKTDNGDLYTADKVIVTTPLGALKSSHSTLFNPPLPSAKQKAIDNFNISYYEKALLEFNDAWWPENFSYYQLWTNNDYKELSGEREWLSTLLGFSIVDENPKMLVAYFKGPKACLLKNVSDETFKTELLELLRKSIAHSIPDPVRFHRTNWSGNPRFFGGYSYHSHSSYMANVSTYDLEEPIDNRIYFAGEHTVNDNWGSLIGDIQSGQIVVQNMYDIN